MTIVIDAVYENGVLKPATPLPFKENEIVRATIEAIDEAALSWAPLINCHDASLIEQAALDPELEF
jgi:predicted DNA-binding antitoxin AbrB/MazE fold protein